MIKKIPKEAIRPGMFISDFNIGWLNHPFAFNTLLVEKESEIKKILASKIVEVYIDTERGLDVGEPAAPEPVQETIVEVLPPPPEPPREGPAAPRTSHQEELVEAREIAKEANALVTDLLNDVRLGKRIEVEKANPVVARITDSILRNPGTLTSLCRIKTGDDYTFKHSVSICTLMVAFCRYMDMDPAVIHEAGIGGMFHDIGKMLIPNEILNKPESKGRLTPEEFEIMKTHVTLSIEKLREMDNISPTIMNIAAQHHEKFGGGGYPYGLKGDEISPLGRMGAIVDVYDALTSNRIYHRGKEPSEVLGLLWKWSDPKETATPHLDLELVQHFIKSLGIYPISSLVRLESDRLAVVIEQNHADKLQYPKVRVIFDIRKNAMLTPFDVDLAEGTSGGDHIVSTEDPETWKRQRIDPMKFLTMDI